MERVNEQKGKNNFPFSVCQILDAVVIARTPSGGILQNIENNHGNNDDNNNNESISNNNDDTINKHCVILMITMIISREEKQKILNL